ncbi:glycosyltransferase family 2 protein [Ginsengibacter hankyongi]|uniref:Glycosyltransferase family 2 protein n=1 Tax=Ginsengibacter hankyongi TaxID=2607284 RepID=A0A5J5IRR2_9BACT|nr:glycosyltransferase family 2 protein [Ginsengibacter hankyongi]
MSLPSVAVVILNWNGKPFLEKFLPFVLESTYNNFSVIVADNASDDDSVDFLKKNYPAIKIILSNINEGFAKGYNTALQQVSADYYILLNSDVEVTADWIEPVISLMESDEKIAACQPKVLSYTEKTKFEYAGASGGFIDILGYPFSRGRIFETCETDSGQYDNAMQIFWATGAALFVRAKVFHELNGFDEFFFAHQEEIDLCWRMQRKGYIIYVVPASVVYHVGGGALPMGSRKKVFLNFRNNLVMITKNLPVAEKVWKIPLRIFLDVIAAYRSLVDGNFSTFISIASAHMHYAEWLLIGKRGEKFPKLKMKTIVSVYDRSIVWQYFIKKKKTFSEIIPLKK